MIIQKTFGQWLQQLNPGLHIEPVSNIIVDENLKKLGRRENPDVDILYYKKKRLCCVPKGLKEAKGWSKIHDIRQASGYVTSDGIAHRTLSGIGLILLAEKLITEKQFVDFFITSDLKKLVQDLLSKGLISWRPK